MHTRAGKPPFSNGHGQPPPSAGWVVASSFLYLERGAAGQADCIAGTCFSGIMRAMPLRGRRIITVETLDTGGIVRATGDAGTYARAYATDVEMMAFVSWYLTAPAVEGAQDAVSFQMPAMTMFEAEALEKKTRRRIKHESDPELLPTESQVKPGHVKLPDKPDTTPDPVPTPQQDADTQIIPPARWARPH